jgi:hypothetical protein
MGVGSEHQILFGDGGWSETVGFIFFFRLSNSSSLGWYYANGSVVEGYNVPTFFTGYNNTWVHFAIVSDYSGKTIKWYKNGILIQTDIMSGTPVFPSVNNIKGLGGFNGGVFPIMDGNLDDMRIYNRGLSASEIKALYEGTK